jgi:hypothetical protein
MPGYIFKQTPQSFSFKHRAGRKWQGQNVAAWPGYDWEDSKLLEEKFLREHSMTTGQRAERKG